MGTLLVQRKNPKRLKIFLTIIIFHQTTKIMQERIKKALYGGYCRPSIHAQLKMKLEERERGERGGLREALGPPTGG